MLRSVLSRTSSVALAGGRRANGHLSHSNPSTTTSVLLSRLPTNIVENELKTALADVKCRKIELEPGCSLHFASECEAKIAAKSIETKFGTKSFVSQVSMPCLLLQNIPEDISADELAKTFVAQAPKTVHISGSNTLRVAVADEQDALKAITALHQVKVGTHSLKTSTVKLANGTYILSVFNYPASTPVETVAGQINQALDSADVKSHSKVELVSQSLVAKKTVSVRFPSHANIHEKELQAALDQSHPNAFKISKVSSVQKPALFLRNLQRLEAETIPTVVAGHEKGIERIQWLRPGKDLEPHMAVVYFNSEEAAFGALKHIQNSLFDGQKISATYKGASEPAVLVTNLPADSTEADVILFSSNNLKHERVDIIDAPDGTKSALVIVSSPRDAKITKTFFDGKIFKGSKIAAEERELNDHAVEIVPTGKGSAELSPSVVAAAFQGLASPKSIAFQTNTNAHISFITVQDAQRALERFNRGDVQLKSAASSSGTAAGNLVGASVSVLPAYVAQVQGLGTDVPVRKLVDHLAADLPAAKVLKADRSALLKFRRNSEVLPGLKQIKATQVSGQNIKAERYRPLQVQGDSAYDTLTSTQDKNQMAFERFNLTILMKDFMHLDPATRYQIAKNMFQRELFDARGKEEEEDPDIAMFAANFTPEAASEIHDLFYFEGIAENMDSEEADRRLFQYYLQLQDMRKYSADFAELSGLLGHADESDNTDWSQLNLGAAGMLEQMQADLQRAHELATEELINKAKGRAGAVLRDFEKSMGHAVFNPDAGSDDEGSDDEDAAVSSSVEVQPSSAASDEFDLAGMGSDDEFDSDFEALEGKDGSSSDSSSSSSDSGFDSDENELQRAARKAKKEAERKHRAENMHEESDGEGGVRMVYRDPVPENIKGLKFADDEGNHLNIVPDRNGDFVDESGTTWSMVVIDTDTTQKTLAGGRFVTHRALVVMGNLKGSAGFGMGKGKGPPEALTAACRNAMRNLVHIDLYDNFGLAHDLYGKHNACHCVIRATPASREMVASPLIEEILNRIGIASASVKMIGNRNPYSQVNALFNALSKHQNLDEFAKARGKRYLSIRWAHENNI